MCNIKKLIALVMCAVALLGILAGCGNNAEQNPTETTDAVIKTPVTKGMLVLNVGACLNISYDGDGLVLNVEGADDNGSILASEYEDYLGKSCAEAVADLVLSAVGGTYLSEQVNDIIIKQAVGSVLPGSNFLEGIVTEAEAAAKKAGVEPNIIKITEAELDEDGYIDLATAKILMLAALDLDSFDTLDGTAEPIEGNYCFSIVAGSTEGTYIIDGVTGNVYEGVLDGFMIEEDYLDEDILDEDITEEHNETQSLPEETVTVNDPTTDDSNDPTITE